MSDPSGGKPQLRRLVLDVDAWTLLQETAGREVPAEFTTAWPTTDPGQVEAARRAAQGRLRDAGLIDASGDIHPSLAAALILLADARMRVRVRSWNEDRTVVGELAVGGDGGIAVARMRRQASSVNQAQEAVGVEVSVFPLDDVMAGIVRLLPDLPPGGTDDAVFSLPAPDLMTLADALRISDSAPNYGDETLAWLDMHVAELLREEVGMPLPSWLEALATRLDGAVEILVVATPPTDHASPRAWFGSWLVSRGHLVAVGARAGARDGAFSGRTFDDSVSDGHALDPWVTLVETDQPGLITDVTAALVEAWEWAYGTPLGSDPGSPAPADTLGGNHG